MKAYVLKSWKVSEQPVDNEDHYVVIQARSSGLLAWILNLINLVPTISLMVTSNRLEFSIVSFASEEHSVVPLENLSSTTWGYFKPWRETIRMFLGLFLFAAMLAVGLYFNKSSKAVVLLVALGGFVLAGVCATIYYFLNRTFIWSVLEVSGAGYIISFRRSAIEAQDVKPAQAEAASAIIEALIEAKHRKYMPRVPESAS
jgi:hypothetical protein